MSDEKCAGCAAPLQGNKFTCGYCGRSTQAAAKSAEDEFELLREVGRFAQALAAGGAESRLEAFWQSAPMPRFPEALAQACRESLAGVTGATDGNYKLNGDQKALFSRAEACLNALASHPGQEETCRLLREQVEVKRKLVELPWHKKGDAQILFFIGGCLVFMFGLTLLVILMSRALKFFV